MALTVQTNNAAITALKHLNNNNISMNRALERLSSGFRINSAADDASGYAISSKLNAQGERLKAAVQNGLQATAMVKMADAAVNEIQNMIVRVQTLAIQGSSANNTAEATKLDAERLKLEGQINKIANGTNYNGVNLLNGIDSASAASSGTAFVAATNGFTNVAAASGVNGLSVAGTALFSNAANFTVTQDISGFITSITSSAALLDNAGATIAAAGANLVATAQTAVGALAVASIGITFTSTVATAAPAAGTTTVTFTAGTDFVAATAAGAGAYTGSLNFQVGDANNINHQVGINLQNSYTTTALGLSGTAGALLTAAGSAAYIDTAIAAIDTLTNQRADLGATQNQLQFVNANLATAIEQVSSAVSSIRDADMAAEMTNFTKSQILVQAGTSMLAQANQASQNVLSLFR